MSAHASDLSAHVAAAAGFRASLSRRRQQRQHHHRLFHRNTNKRHTTRRCRGGWMEQQELRQVRASSEEDAVPLSEQIGIQGVHHVAVIVENLERSMAFYQGLLGLPVNPDRPNDKLPYDGAWLMMGPEMVHLMELPNPDPTHLQFRPEHGGKDRHFCIGVKNLAPLVAMLERESIPFTASRSGRPAIFFRDPDCNTLEVVEGLDWR